jgi:CheY-like chemotaxis protein
MATVVVCDDDSVARSAVSSLCEEAGLQVVAETDRGGDAIELIRRFGVDVLVLDLSLPDGPGEGAIEALCVAPDPPAIVVFTAYARDAARLLGLGAAEVVEKPAFGDLRAALDRVRQSVDVEIDLTDAATERRFASRVVLPAPPLWRSPSGVSTEGDLDLSLAHVIEGDAVLVVALQDVDGLDASVGAALATDCRLLPGRLLRTTLRAQDVVHDAPEVDGFVAILRGGDDRAAEAAWHRLQDLAQAIGVPGRLAGAHTQVDAMGGADAVARAVVALPTVVTDAALVRV